MNYVYKTNGICASHIALDINDNIITNVVFKGGCNGNLKAITTLIDGWTVDDIETKLTGIQCGFKSTSCADQLAKAVRAAYEEANNN